MTVGPATKATDFVASCQFYRIVTICQQVATNVSTSIVISDKIRLVTTCHYLQTCFDLFKQLAYNLYLTIFGNQPATSLLTTGNRLVVDRLSQAMRNQHDIGLWAAKYCSMLLSSTLNMLCVLSVHKNFLEKNIKKKNSN